MSKYRTLCQFVTNHVTIKRLSSDILVTRPMNGQTQASTKAARETLGHISETGEIKLERFMSPIQEPSSKRPSNQSRLISNLTDDFYSFRNDNENITSEDTYRVCQGYHNTFQFGAHSSNRHTPVQVDVVCISIPTQREKRSKTSAKRKIDEAKNSDKIGLGY